MESEIFNNFKVKIIDGTYWVVGSSNQEEDRELKIASVAHYVRHPKAVADAIAAGLNNNKKLLLIDLI